MFWVQKHIDDTQTDSQKPHMQIICTALANPTLLLTDNIKFGEFLQQNKFVNE